MKSSYPITAVLIAFLSLVTAIPPLRLPSNTTTISASDGTTNLHDPPIPTFCNASAQWISPQATQSLYPDCVLATLSFLRTADQMGDEIFEFHGRDSAPIFGSRALLTPRRYTSGSCTILIANLHGFPPRWLPAAQRKPYPVTEVAYFRDLFEAVDAVMGTCMEGVGRARRLGWANGAKQSRLVGELGGIGVFLIGKDSEIDRALPQGAGSTNLERKKE